MDNNDRQGLPARRRFAGHRATRRLLVGGLADLDRLRVDRRRRGYLVRHRAPGGGAVTNPG